MVKNMTAHYLQALLSVTLAGCAASLDPPSALTIPKDQAAQMLRDRESELATARAEVATAKIAQAKQDAEVQELRVIVQQLRQDNSESHVALMNLRRDGETRQADLEGARRERQQQESKHADQLHDLQSTVAILTEELGQLKQRMEHVTLPSAKETGELRKDKPVKSEVQEPPFRAMPSILRSQMPLPSVNAGVAQTNLESVMTIIVQPGDTLWNLARRHRTTVSQLRQVNHLDRDMVLVGSVLILPASE
jgi:nucleoid-associated protein YgaU